MKDASRKVHNDAHATLPVCPGPWTVHSAIGGVIVIWRCDNCGNEWMVFRGDPAKPQP